MYKLSPSKAHRFLTCTKSLEFDVEFIETPYTIRGSLLHELAEMIIKNKEVNDFYKEHKISDYEHFLVSGYAESVFDEYQKINAHTLIVEEKKGIEIFDFKINLIVDALAVGDKVASIIDLKTGNNDIDVKDNEQLMFYGYSVIYHFPNIERVRMSIFQKGKLKTMQKTKDEILDFFIDSYDIFKDIQENKLSYKPSDKACKFCPIKDTCKARALWIIEGKP